MKAFVFPGQGAQFVGMGKDLYESSPLAKELFEKANEILGYRITDIMFEGTDEDLRFDANPDEIEFCDFGWFPAHEVPALVIDFKKDVYLKVMAEFTPLIKKETMK